MKNCRKMVLFTCFAMLVLAQVGWAMDYEEDSLVEAEAQKDMLAYVQSTFPSRFGSDLQAGDFVRYEIADHHSQTEEPELCSLEVIARIGDVATIKEEFEGNLLYYKIDLQSNTLQEYWGFDEDGTEQRPVLLSASEVNTRLLSMRGQLPNSSNQVQMADIPKPVFSSLAQRESVALGRSSLNCTVKALAMPDIEGISPEIREAVQEASKIYFSESIPKMLPAKLMANYMDSLDLFIGNNGLVKQSVYQIRDFIRTNK